MIISRRAWQSAANSMCFVCGRIPFVKWTTFSSRNAAHLCQDHLDIWLDNADDDPFLEPAKVEFLWGEFRDLS